MQENQHQEVEIKEFHVSNFVQQIVDLTKAGWELKDPSSVNYCAQWIGSMYTVHMIKKDTNTPEFNHEDVKQAIEEADRGEFATEEEVEEVQQRKPVGRAKRQA